MGVEEDWILFLEKNPQFYELSKGDFFIRFLKELDTGAKTFSEIRATFPIIEEEDVNIILDSLLKLKVVFKSTVNDNFFYSLSEDGKKLLSTYNKTHEFFKT
tara:strand:- start:103 stop:408 length:306 start_codon:yes stop_codon:yes gene_type:complete